MTIFPSIFHKKCQAKRLENEVIDNVMNQMVDF